MVYPNKEGQGSSDSFISPLSHRRPMGRKPVWIWAAAAGVLCPLQHSLLSRAELLGASEVRHGRLQNTRKRGEMPGWLRRWST